MHRRLLVDPRFSTRLRELRASAGLSLRELGRLVPCSHAHIRDLETGRRQPSPELAARLDSALAAGGDLAGLVRAVETPSEFDRLSHVAARPRLVDAIAVDALESMLAEQRRLEDTIGSMPLVEPAQAQLATVTDLVRDAADNALRVRLVDVASQWAQFTAWLCTTTGDLPRGRRLYLRAMEWASEAGNPHMVATALSMRGHLAWIAGEPRAMVELSRAAQWPPAAPAVRALAIQQEARGLAILGDPAVARRLDAAEELAHRAAGEDGPPWLYFYDPHFFDAQRGLAMRLLGRHEEAVELLDGALARLPVEIRSSDWIGWYVLQLAGSYAVVGEREAALAALADASRIAERAAAARLRSEVEQLAAGLA
jgi:transcriptional regulator with XRE-family HTH domain